MGAILTNEPKIFSNLFRELSIYWPLEVSQKYISESEGSVMGQKDFSVQVPRKEWEKFNPRFRRNHNFLNQTVSYLWNKWLSKLPRTKHSLVFEKTLPLFDDLFSNPNRLDKLRLYSNDNVSVVNQRIIEILYTELEKVFRHDLLQNSNLDFDP